jgi:CRP/FNR family transcriptional regulator, cyclic AMP receptor protein
VTATPDVTEQLRSVELFADLSPRDLRGVAAAGRWVVHAPGHEVVVEGGGSVGFHLVLEGEALVDVGGESRPSLTRGDSFGEISLLDGLPRTASITAGPAGLVTFAVTAWSFGALLDKHPQLARAVIATLCARLRSVEQAAVRARAAVAAG